MDIETLPEARTVITYLCLVAGRLGHNVNIDLMRGLPRDLNDLETQLDRTHGASEDAAALLNAARALYRRVTVVP